MVRAIKAGRKSTLFELNETYAKAGAIYLQEEEIKSKLPTLFDVLKETEA